MNNYSDMLKEKPALNDEELLHAFLHICKESHRFYSRAVAVTCQHQVRNLFRRLSKVRLDLIALIRHEMGDMSGLCIADIPEEAQSIGDGYRKALTNITQTDVNELASQMLVLEVNSLRLFRRVVRNLNDRRLSARLATLIAEIQMANDGFKKFSSAA